MPQESLACVLFLCPADVTHELLTQLPAIDQAVSLGSCGLLSLCGAHTGRLCKLGNGLHRLRIPLTVGNLHSSAAICQGCVEGPCRGPTGRGSGGAHVDVARQAVACWGL